MIIDGIYPDRISEVGSYTDLSYKVGIDVIATRADRSPQGTAIGKGVRR